MLSRRELLTKLSAGVIATFVKWDLPLKWVPDEVKQYGALHYLTTKFNNFMQGKGLDGIHHINIYVGYDLYWKIEDELTAVYRLTCLDNIGNTFMAFKGARLYPSGDLGWGLRIEKVKENKKDD